MRKVYSTLLSLSIVFGAFAQQYSKVSPTINSWLQSYEKHGAQAAESVPFQFASKRYDGFDAFRRIPILVKAEGDINKELEAEGIRINSQFGDIYSLHVNVAEMATLAQMPEVIRLELPPRATTRLKNARRLSKVTEVHAGTGLKRQYHGAGVVVGVIDVGLDFTHPMFYTADGNDTRIKRAWVTSDNSGTPPSGFTYGTELSSVSDLSNYQSSNSGASHGTHVAGIAAGSAYGSPDFLGVADSAEIVFVETGESVADELNYIFNYAKSVSKPAVVNMSLGSHIGPHDGTSLLDQAIDNLAKEGQIIVGACGNEGGTPMHIKKTFSGDTLYTIPELSNQGFTTVDMWGDRSTPFMVNVLVWDGINSQVAYETDFMSTSANDSFDTVLVSGNDSISFELGGELSSLNQKSHAKLEILANNANYTAYIALTAPNGTVHLWNDGDGNGAAFIDDNDPDFTAGDVNSTMGEIGATANEIIAVGSFTGTTSYTSLINSNVTNTTEAEGEIAEYSSQGPTVDGRVKPEITAPGNYVLSALNSFDQNYLPGGAYEDDITDSIMDGSDYWYYGAQSGTSMASPMVAGIVALMLQQNPKLTPADVKKLLMDYAMKDSHTGSIPSGGSNVWGHGKVDAQAMLISMETNDPGAPTQIAEVSKSNLIKVFPNPVNDVLTIEGTDLISARIIDVTGKSGELVQLDGDQDQVDLTELQSGVYFLEVSTASETEFFRLLKK